MSRKWGTTCKQSPRSTQSPTYWTHTSWKIKPRAVFFSKSIWMKIWMETFKSWSKWCPQTRHTCKITVTLRTRTLEKSSGWIRKHTKTDRVKWKRSKSYIQRKAMFLHKIRTLIMDWGRMDLLKNAWEKALTCPITLKTAIVQTTTWMIPI